MIHEYNKFYSEQELTTPTVIFYENSGVDLIFRQGFNLKNAFSRNILPHITLIDTDCCLIFFLEFFWIYLHIFLRKSAKSAGLFLPGIFSRRLTLVVCDFISGISSVCLLKSFFKHPAD